MGSIEVIAKDNGITVKGLSNFNLKETFECGQCFRWNKINNKYRGVVNDKVLEVYRGDNDLLNIDGITVDDYIDYYENYFDVRTNYERIYKMLKSDPVFYDNTPATSGIRILKQDLFETLISFMISANNNIPRIKLCIENLCSLYGTTIMFEDIEYHLFPTLEQLSNATLEQLKYVGLGYRAEYILKTISMIKTLDKNHGNWEDYIRSMNYPTAKRTLMNFVGVGPKVADCICLFALNHTEAFPIDTWIKKILFKLYGIRVNDEYKVKEFIETRFGKLAGYAQQYLFYYKRGKI